jgi:hypothetical protein
VVEGTPLLRAQTGNRLEGSNPFVSATDPRLIFPCPNGAEFPRNSRRLRFRIAERDAPFQAQFTK